MNKEIAIINEVQLDSSFIQENIIENTGLNDKYFYFLTYGSLFHGTGIAYILRDVCTEVYSLG